MKKRTNIIFILSDDQGYWTMGCSGNAEVKTPNLDRLAASGTMFTNFFCASPVCSPARASIVTGRMPSAHGIHDWLGAGDTIQKYEPGGRGEQIEYLAGQVSYTDHLAEAGYTCGISGKWHLGASHTSQKSFSFWKTHAKGGGPYYSAPVTDGDDVIETEEYITDYITDNALEFLNNQNGEAPFYLGIHYTAPHAPWSRENHPSKVWDDYYNNCSFNSAPVEQKHPCVGNKLWPATAEDRRKMLSGYYTSISEMDRNIGRIMDWLEENNLRDNTLIFFTSDNGMNMGHHGLYGKGNASFPQNMYDTSVKVPAIISHPRMVPEGEICPAMLSHYDLFPTFMDVANLEMVDHQYLPGQSILPVLQGETGEIHQDLVMQSEYGPVRMIRTEKMKYVHRYPYGPHELYDLVNDPDECFNIVDLPKYKETVVELFNKMENWFRKYSDCNLDGRSLPVQGFGQIEKLNTGFYGKDIFR